MPVWVPRDISEIKPGSFKQSLHIPTVDRPGCTDPNHRYTKTFVLPIKCTCSFFKVTMLYTIQTHITGSTQTYPHCKEDPIYVFPEMKLRGPVPNFHIHVSVSGLYISAICPPVLLQELGRAVSFLGILVSNFGSSVLVVQTYIIPEVLSVNMPP
jgi:hypothetical protein